MNDPQQDPTDEELDAAQGAGAAAPGADTFVIAAPQDSLEESHRFTDQGA